MWARVICLSLLLCCTVARWTIQHVETSDRFEQIRIVDHEVNGVYRRDLIFGNYPLLNTPVQGSIVVNEDRRDRSILLEYINLMVSTTNNYLGGSPTSVLIAGMGAGIIPQWYINRNVSVDVVEIDADVIRLAEIYFDFDVSKVRNMYVMDFKEALQNNTNEYEAILIDIDCSDPYYFDEELIDLIKAHTAPGGICVVNTFDESGDIAKLSLIWSAFEYKSQWIDVQETKEGNPTNHILSVFDW